MRERKFLFNYRLDGVDYGLDVVAETPQEAKRKVASMSLARYEGEIFATIPVPAVGLLLRILGWLKRPRGPLA